MSTSAPRAPGITRIDLQEHDLSVPGRQVIQSRVEVSPEAPAFRHKHPGEEVIYVLEGTLEYTIDGQGARTYSAGEALMVPAETVGLSKERRQRRRRGARHVRRRERETIPRTGRVRVDGVEFGSDPSNDSGETGLLDQLDRGVIRAQRRRAQGRRRDAA